MMGAGMMEGVGILIETHIRSRNLCGLRGHVRRWESDDTLFFGYHVMIPHA